MADASLDDFFAKKDKSKKKSKSSKLTPTEILAEADQPAKKEKKKRDKDKSQSSTNSTTNSDTVGLPEEEWKEQEEEKEKDYSGLRIANLQVSEKEVEDSEDGNVDNENDEDEDGESRERRDGGQQGPWKAGSGPPTSAPAEPKPKVEVTPKEESKPATGKYIPPSQRGAAAGGDVTGITIPAHLRRKKNAPNLRSEDDFPTLGGGPPQMQFDSDPRNFERVHHGGRQQDDPTKASQQLSLGNKFSALQD